MTRDSYDNWKYETYFVDSAKEKIDFKKVENIEKINEIHKKSMKSVGYTAEKRRKHFDSE